jgi:hypothetical protein
VRDVSRSVHDQFICHFSHTRVEILSEVVQHCNVRSSQVYGSHDKEPGDHTAGHLSHERSLTPRDATAFLLTHLIY